MKKFLTLSSIFLAVIILSAAMTGCKNREKKDKDANTSASIKLVDYASLKQKLISSIKDLPSGIKADASQTPSSARINKGQGKINFGTYTESTVLSLSQAEKMMATKQKAFGSGIYVADMLNAMMNQRPDKVAEIGNVARNLLTDIGLASMLDKDGGRIKEAIDNINSKEYIENFISANVGSFVEEHIDDAEIAVYIYAILGFYIETQYLILISEDLTYSNSEVTDYIYILNKPEFITEFHQLLGLVKDDPNIAPIYNEYQKVVDIYTAENLTTKNCKKISDILLGIRNTVLN